MQRTKEIPPLRRVVRREWCRMTSRRLYFGVCVVLPLFVLFFMSTIFHKGVMEEIPVAVIDLDYTATSRTVTRTLAAVPTFRLEGGYTDEAQARQAMQAKKIYGYLVIPPRFEADAVAGKGATLAYYYHYALLSVGGEVMAAFETALIPVQLAPIVMEAVALGVDEQQIETFLLPAQVSSHPVYNPALDYTVYLGHPFFFVFFQILILLTTVYVVGSEMKFHTGEAWLAAARYNMFTALMGKLLPYTLIYSLVAVAANGVLFGMVKIPLNGSFTALVLVAILLVIATQALAVFLFSLFPAIAIVISIASMVGSLGATLSGVTFPVANMYAPVYGASFLLPIRHFTVATQSMLYFDGRFADYWPSVAVLFIYPLLAFLLLPRLQRSIILHRYEKIR